MFTLERKPDIQWHSALPGKDERLDRGPDDSHHVSIHDEDFWVQRFAENGFERVHDLDARFVSEWAIIFKRVRDTPVFRPTLPGKEGYFTG